MVSRRGFFTAIVPAFGLAMSASPAFADSPDSIEAQVAIIKAGANAGAISALKKVPSVGVVRINLFAYPYETSEWPSIGQMRIYAQNNPGGINRMRAALAGNPATRKSIESRGISMRQIVGCKIYSNGSIRVFLL